MGYFRRILRTSSNLFFALFGVPTEEECNTKHYKKKIDELNEEARYLRILYGIEQERARFGLRNKGTDEYYNRYHSLLRKYNSLVDRINRLGGENFLVNARLPSKGYDSSFSKNDIRRLIQLCHPDKHNGSPMAAELTAKLNSLKDKQ